MCDFSGETFKGFEVPEFSMSATTTQLLSSGEFYKFRCDTIPFKSTSANVSFFTNNSKMPNFELWHCCRKWAILYLWFSVTTVMHSKHSYVLPFIMVFMQAYICNYVSVLYSVVNQIKVNFSNINGGRNNTCSNTHTHTHYIHTHAHTYTHTSTHTQHWRLFCTRVGATNSLTNNLIKFPGLVTM